MPQGTLAGTVDEPSVCIRSVAGSLDAEARNVLEGRLEFLQALRSAHSYGESRQAAKDVALGMVDRSLYNDWMKASGRRK